MKPKLFHSQPTSVRLQRLTRTVNHASKLFHGWTTMERCPVLVVHRTKAYVCFYRRVSSAAIQQDRRGLIVCFVANRTQEIDPIPPSNSSIVRAKISADTYHDIVSCCTKEVDSLSCLATSWRFLMARLGTNAFDGFIFSFSSLIDHTELSRKRLKALRSPRNPICWFVLFEVLMT